MIPNLAKIPGCVERAVINAFKVQLSSTCSVKNLSMKLEDVKLTSVDCLSTIILQSSNLTGSISIAFPKNTFLKTIEKMIGEPVGEITSENCDASSEMLNIIYGQARREINELNFDFSLAIPSTVIGNNLSIAKSNLLGHILFFNCTSELGEFVVLLSLKTKDADKN